MIERLLKDIPDELNIEELAYHVSEILEKLSIGQFSKRVSSFPIERTIRYYRTRGLIDPPVGYRKKRALYTKRHLLQIVAIKVLEARGFSLTLIGKILENERNRLINLIESSYEFEPLKYCPPTEFSPRILSARDKGIGESIRWFRFEIDDGVELLIRENYVFEENRTKFLSKKFEKIIKSFGGEQDVK
jgi:DNA-binding transcriptional MerR regulator